MTIAAQTPPLAFDTIEEAVGAVRDRGMRLSTARRLVLEAFFAAEGPVSAVHLARTLLIDETSVYRNLEVLERHGLIRHVHLGHGPGLYVLVGRHEVEYLYCERCAKVTAVTPDQLDPVRKSIKKRFGYEARFTHFAIVGLCGQCADQAPTSSGSDHKSASGARVSPARSTRDENLHSHGDYVHSHPRANSGAKQQPAR
jgi:Fur family ferric uptake transcriptional regulator